MSRLVFGFLLLGATLLACCTSKECKQCRTWDVTEEDLPPEQCRVRSLVVTVEGSKETFKSPDGLKALSDLEMVLVANKMVEKTISIASVIKKVVALMSDNQGKAASIPGSRSEIAQILLLIEMGGGSLDLLVDAGYAKASILVQMKESGPEWIKDMKSMLRALKKSLERQADPLTLELARASNCLDGIPRTKSVFKLFESIRLENEALIIGSGK
jgi:hypothetical protein